MILLGLAAFGSITILCCDEPVLVHVSCRMRNDVVDGRREIGEVEKQRPCAHLYLERKHAN